MRVVALRHQIYRAHQRGMQLSHGLLQGQCQTQIIAPVRMLEPAAVRADQQHHLAGNQTVLLGHGLVYHVAAAQRVAVHVDHDGDFRMFGQNRGNGSAGAAIGAGVAGIVIDTGVVQNCEPRGLENLCQLFPNTENIIVRVLGAAGVARRVAVKPGLCIGLARVGMDNQNLYAVRRQADRRSCL